MKILANKEIKNLFHSLSLVFGVTFLLAEVFLWLSYRRLFSVIANPFFYWLVVLYGQSALYILIGKIRSWSRRYYKSMRILMVIAMPVLNVTMRANCTDCFIPSIL